MNERPFSPSAVDAIERRALEELAAAKTVEDVRAAHGAALGKRGELTALNALLRALAPEERKAAGALLNDARARITSAYEARLAEVEARARTARLEQERLDLTEVPPGPRRGSLTLVTQTRDALEDTFVGMGFVVAEGPEVESDWHNFEALNMPPAHPARSGFDTLYLDWGEPETTLLRTHTSPVQVRLMLEQPPPIYAVMPGRVYRKDTPDARHTPSFSQIEGLVVDHGITFGDLAGTIDTFTRAYFGPNISARLRPAYFPFTEPSAEFEITCTICEGAGCRTCSWTGWVELGGCGMVHPNVFVAVGIDPEEWTGFAFGFGIDRLAQMRFGIPDMRVLADNDLRFTAQF
ncbi:MAG TPA: phenylalanine--tRNA ligase subunit alpha [Acidimicrobiales bacterium]|nr:phenylalanine--tRNA ligase subunit alpha [Acidimicrobiales bacterium]